MGVQVVHACDCVTNVNLMETPSPLSATWRRESMTSMMKPPHRHTARTSLAIVAAMAALVAGSCGTPGDGSASPARAASPAASAPGRELVSPSASAPVPPPFDTLAAVRVVRTFSDLLDRGRWGQAQRLLSARRVWPRRDMITVRSAHFRSAEVWGDPSADALTLAVRIKVRVGPGSPLSDGVTTLFFHLRRTGTDGDWLVTAIGTSP
jgi:hypothetical protein